jgi:hypothetical protein
VESLGGGEVLYIEGVQSNVDCETALRAGNTCFSETSVLTRATRRHIPQEDILQSHRREDLKTHIALTG